MTLLKRLKRKATNLGPISFTCPHCGTCTEVAAEYAGKSGPCAACRKPVTIPEAVDLKSVRPTRWRKVARFLMTSAVLLLLIGLGTVIFSLVFVVAFDPSSIPFLGGTSPPPPVCEENLLRIGQAIQSYVAANGHYPPAYTVDGDGKRLHSWRVLLLPYLNEQRLYGKIDLNKPWDDPVNLQATSRMPEVYGCPLDTNRLMDETNYMVINGPTLLFNGPENRKLKDISDQASQTIVVVEVADAGINWMEPKDLVGSNMDWRVNASPGLGSRHYAGGIHVLMADGQVKHFGNFIPVEDLQGMATIHGGETVAPDEWVDDGTNQ